MDSFSWFIRPIIKQWYLFSAQSLLEILFFSTVFYYFSLWLRRDRRTNLLPLFYGYCATAMIAQAVGMTSVCQFLFMFAPVTLMLFIIVHQETLQKNFIVSKNITPAKNHDWLNILMQSLLTTTHKNRSVICVIEKQDMLNTLLASPVTLNTGVQKDLLNNYYVSSTLL